MTERTTLAEREDPLKIVYYGEPGTGKTTESAGLARLGRIVHINAEAGLKRKPLIDHGIPVANIEIHEEIAFDALQALGWELRDEIHDGDAPIGVIWDSTSEVHKLLLVQASERTYEKKTSKGVEWEQNFIALEDYGTNANEMRKLIRLYRDLPVHVAFVCLERRDQNEETGEVSIGPDLTPKLQEDLMGYVDVVCHCYTEDVDGSDEPEFWGRFRPHGVRKGKDRFHTLPPRLINPSMDRVLAYLSGELDVESDPQMQAARARRSDGKIKEPTPSPDEREVAQPAAAPAAKKVAGPVKKVSAK